MRAFSTGSRSVGPWSPEARSFPLRFPPGWATLCVWCQTSDTLTEGALVDQLTIRPLVDPGAFALEGELDLASAEELLTWLRAAPAEADLTVDLSGLTFMDSSGLRVFLEAACTRNHGSSVVLKNPSDPVARVLEIAVPGGGPGLKIEWSDRGSHDGRGTLDAR